jgi:diguanylate cyclase (GGDEF)-like protein
VDVDNFKTINDTLGHDAGDAMLCVFADRLSAALRTGDLVTRTGGDEFAFLISAASEFEVSEIVEEIYAALAQPFVHDGRTLDCGASIGASLVPRDGSTRSEIMKAADIALYAAKANGRGQLKIFEPSMKAEVDHREEMMASARLALQLDRVVPWFQPKVSLRGSRVIGFEALMRWTDTEEAVRGPEEVMAAFNDPALGVALSERMLEHTLDQMRTWLKSGVAFGHVALNATAADLRREGYADMVMTALAQRAIPPTLLQIEVTETVFLGHASGHVETTLRALNRHGVRIALDDFGTGYASLSHLNQFPVDLLKIDRSFIGLLGSSLDAEAISCAVINLGRSLGLEVVAEGIETEAQEARLIELGCNTGQGFLYSKAIPGAEVPRLLAGWPWSRPASSNVSHAA